MSSEHCKDNGQDRDIGAFWERQFCLLAVKRGFVLSPLQLGRNGSAVAWCKDGDTWNSFTLPDVTIWTCPGQYHEIKHKAPTRYGTFGLEAYRFHALLDFAHVTGQAVLYTIHNHALFGGRDGRVCRLKDWVVADVRALENKWCHKSLGPSWVNGVKAESVLTYYWYVAMWKPLERYWDSLVGISEKMAA